MPKCEGECMQVKSFLGPLFDCQMRTNHLDEVLCQKGCWRDPFWVHGPSDCEERTTPDHYPWVCPQVKMTKKDP